MQGEIKKTPIKLLLAFFAVIDLGTRNLTLDHDVYHGDRLFMFSLVFPSRPHDWRYHIIKGAMMD